MPIKQHPNGPRVKDHPVRLHRLRLQLTTGELSRRAGVSRSAVTALEDGRTIAPAPDTVQSLAEVLGVYAEDLEREMAAWRERFDAQPALLNAEQRARLALGPDHVRSFPSFRAWRESIAPTRTAFAALLGLNHTVVSQYEQGIRVRGMPDVLISALLRRLQLTPAMLAAVQELEPDHEQ
jgi:transcriptional regulator with XRE-family HTH domain